MKTNEIRRRFMDFFVRNAHTELPSASLVPADDPTLLFTGAGMNQFKDEFYGRGDASLKRAVTCQKCIRTGDIENVGRTASHHTFFEMLGNFSFGDYFKQDAIVWAWEFLVQEMGLPGEQLSVSIYEKDEEAWQVWKEIVGLPDDRIYRFDEGENYWPPNARTKGPNGPCGPCSEIFWDAGAHVGCGRPDCDPACDCDRFVEIWNLVFQQFDRQPDATLAPLAACNIDTGMGLERMARVMQGVTSNFEIDAFAPTIAMIVDICKADMNAPRDVCCVRRIVDHARAVTFCIADGVIPSNEDRGYVVRRLLRRAVRDAYQLGTEEMFISRLLDPIIESFGDAYPALAASRSHIETVIAEEEKAFQKTVKRGSSLLAQHVATLQQSKASTLRGEQVFDLYQTYGFPIEMTKSLLADEGIEVDMQGFLQEMKAHQALSKKGADFDRNIFAGGPVAELQGNVAATEFTGYQTLESAAKVIGIVAGDALVDAAAEGDEVGVILDRTPAYGESGGQVGDSGCISCADGVAFTFDDTVRERGFFLHVGKVTSGELKVGAPVTCSVCKTKRRAIERNHTGTHLLHYALRQVLGKHAQQAGSHVSAERLRFDFANPSELGAEAIARIEDIVNAKILEDATVTTTRMSLSEAREAGATALFGETYGDIVRVVSTGDFSQELCGGTHCRQTGQIGMLRIVRESSVAGGVRRIEAVTGTAVMDRLRDYEGRIKALSDILNAPSDKLVARAEENLGQIRALQKQVRKQKHDQAREAASGSLLDQAEEIGGVRVALAVMDAGPDELRSAADVLRKENDNFICLLAAPGEEKVALISGVSQDVIARGISAREIAQTAAKILGGGGGGRDDLAQAGGKDASKLDEAFEAVRALLRKKLDA